MGKTYTAKIPSSDFKVITLENPLLSKQVVTSKGISVPYTNLQLNPYPNTQLDLFYSDNLSFQCITPGMWLINCADPSMRLNHQLEKDVDCKVLLFITQWRSRSCLATKSYGVQAKQLLQEKEELGQTRIPVTLFFTLVELFSSATSSPFTALKIILIYVLGCEKRNPKYTFIDRMKKSSEKLSFINLDR